MNFKVAIDCLVFTYDNVSAELKILLTKRKVEPAKGQWAFLGRFVKETESFKSSALKILYHETGSKDIFIEQLNTYNLPGSSPANRIASITFYAIIKSEDFNPSSEDGYIYKWVSVKQAPVLPFDHNQKLKDGIQRIKERSYIKPIIFKFLSPKFTLNQFQNAYENIFDLILDNRNFRRKILNLKYLEQLNELEKNVSRRPGKLYRFNETKYNETVEKFFLL